MLTKLWLHSGMYFEQLRGMIDTLSIHWAWSNVYIGEIITIMESDTVSRETIRRLETDLEVYKRAYADLDAERRRFEMLKLEADKQKEDLENQLKVTLVSSCA